MIRAIVIATAILLLLSGVYYLNRIGFFEKSTVELLTDTQSVNAKFNIAPKDQSALKQFSDNLGVSENWTKGIHLKLDMDNVNFIKQNLPQRVYLSFGPKEIDFNSQGVTILNSPLTGQTTEFATGSGKISFRKSSDQSYSVLIADPEPLVKYATMSGTLYFSKEVEGLFPILSKIATINLSVNGGNLQGRIKLK